MNTQEKLEKAANTAMRLQQLSQADIARRDYLLGYENLLTANADDLIAELAAIDARIEIYAQVTRLHGNYHKEFLDGIRLAAVA